EHSIELFRDEWLDRSNGVEMDKKAIKSIRTLSGKIFVGKVFIDATYEGDLMALSNVKFHVGREANSKYGEKWNGIQVGVLHHGHHMKTDIDPYVVPGDRSSGVLPKISEEDPGQKGEGDDKVQAYCFRMCLSNHPENRVPFPKPENYDPFQYELLARIFDSGWREVFDKFDPIPNRKTDTNNHGPFSTDNIGMNYEYPNGDYKIRDGIIKEHESYQKGLMWFLANDPRLPSHVRDEVKQWGLPKDEFTDNGNWPHQLYIREARRMVSDYVMTQHDCESLVIPKDPVGLAAYTMDSHNVQRYVDKFGKVRNEGNVEVGGFEPYPISFKSIVPKHEECTNLLVPVCLSASHIAFGSIRMEPVFMVLGQSAATAAVLAIDEEKDIQQISYGLLKDQLLKDAQVLEWQDVPIFTGEKEIALRDEISDGVTVTPVEWKDVAPMSYPGQYHEYTSNGGSISYRFNIDEKFDY
ncbi:MAG: FAD-dependent oxidoreductase, partial [Melioribacteraceae bacterium]|nr:FAD-dependent oxidoreductase [Melioribacteraceae bacterium]